MSLQAVPWVHFKIVFYVLDNSRRHSTNYCPTSYMCLLVLFKAIMEIQGKRETLWKMLVQNKAFQFILERGQTVTG